MDHRVAKGWMIISKEEGHSLVEGVYTDEELAKAAWSDCINYYLHKYPTENGLEVNDCESNETDARIWYTDTDSTYEVIKDLEFIKGLVNISLFNPDWSKEFKKAYEISEC